MRLALCVPSLGPGGAERVATHLARGFLDRGHRVCVITVFGPESDFYRLPPGTERVALGLGGSSPRFWGPLWANALRLRALRRSLLKAGPDVAVSFLPQMNVTTLLSAAGTGLPVVVMERADPSYFSPGRVWEGLRRCTYPMAARVVSVSEEVDRHFSWLPARKRAVVHNPVEVEFSTPDPPEAETWVGPETVVSMGRLDRPKGFDLLLEAFGRMTGEAGGWRLVIFGEGPERGELEALRDRLGLKSRVLLPGVVKNPWAALRKAGLFAFPSRSEGFPNALLEAMACGLPAVASDGLAALRELFRPGEEIALFPAEDADALARVLGRLVLDAQERKRLAAAGARAAGRFSLARIVSDWEELFSEVSE